MKLHISMIRIKLVLPALLVLGVLACNSQKETLVNRGMHNLTAFYNILFNATQIVDESQRNIETAYQDNFETLLSVYKEPNETISQSEAKRLDDAIFKANKIINDKSQSVYVPDAYLLIAKANYLKSNFFNAIEFLNYLSGSYPGEKEITQPALVWKARSLMQLNKLKEAGVLLDTALKYKDSDKKTTSDIYATRAQLFIQSRLYIEAIGDLEKALQFSRTHQNKLRWKYLLGQLLEMNCQPDSAYIHYTKVAKSNAPFEMSFNANLNRISIGIKKKNGKMPNRTRQLKSLLRDDKNSDFIDQIYFQVANSYADSNDVENAIKNYNLSIRKSTNNRNQKGLSYLKLAEIYFQRADYVKAKAYYDSTVTSLPPAHPDYKQLKKKAGSLELLANRLGIIARQDSLQALAKLPEAERLLKIDELALGHEKIVLALELEKALAAASKNKSPGGRGGGGSGQSNAVQNGKFYFNNTTAISQGFTEFKKRWGNRELEDNWRRSEKPVADLANKMSDNPDDPNAPPVKATDKNTKSAKTKDDFKQKLIQSIPLTEDKRLASDTLIASAYFDIANYYREVMNDEAEAIRTYEELLRRYPDNKDKLAVYYSLYRLYSTENPEKSDMYKKMVLEQSPDSPFAKTILDPTYNQKNDAAELELNCVYNTAYALFVNKRRSEVMVYVYDAKTQYGKIRFSPQLAYLGSIALGHLQKLPEFEASLKQITTDYPDDKLVVPLVKQHLAYIDSNRTALSSRPTALLDRDPSEAGFIEEPVIEPEKTIPPVAIANDTTKIAKNEKPENKPGKEKEAAKENNKDVPKLTKEELKPPVLPLVEPGFFSLADSNEYYYVVNVPDVSVNLSSSRFGIGQFNRANFAGAGIKHQLKTINDQNQLIFVGVLSSKGMAEDYIKSISPLISQIMKIQTGAYNAFFISKQNLDKLKDRQTVDQYIEFYKKNFQQ